MGTLVYTWDRLSYIMVSWLSWGHDRLSPPALTNNCSKALGMEDRSIPDSAITASSWLNGRYPKLGRLVSSTGYFNFKFWSAKYEMDEYLQVDLGRVLFVTKVASQGGYSSWVKSYSLSYGFNATIFKDFTTNAGLPVVSQHKYHLFCLNSESLPA